MTTKEAEELYKAQHVYKHAGRQPIFFNPHNKQVYDLPCIFAFSNVVDGGDGIAYAMAEDGTVLGSHYCSHEAYVPADLAVIEGWRMDRHEEYRKHYPDGYRMEFVPAREVKAHPGLQRAFELNQKQGEEAKQS